MGGCIAICFVGLLVFQVFLALTCCCHALAALDALPAFALTPSLTFVVHVHKSYVLLL